MGELLSDSIFPTTSTLSSLLPHISLSDWQTKFKYNKDTKFYCGWSFIRVGFTTTVLVAGWEPSLQALLIWGFIPGAGHGWTEQRADNFAPSSPSWVPFEPLKHGAKTAEELNSILPKDKQIPFVSKHSFLSLPSGQKMFL
jgi:hypothetical protein